MSSLEKLKQTTTLKDFAKLIGYQPKTLSYILYQIPEENKYFEFSIPKKNGGERKIKSPNDKLKKLQKKVAKLLNNCLEEILSSHKQSLSHGFRRNHSIVTNARKHKKKRHVFNIDLEKFFPSINFGRVRGFFIKNNHFILQPPVATVIAQIACHDNSLPQGSPCSPVISNLIGHLIDIRMVQLAKKAKCTYSRYADDIIFSTNKKEFPDLIATQDKESPNKWLASDILEKEIGRLGFEINKSKTSLQNKTSRQTATGLVVNNKVNVKVEYCRIARAMCNQLFATNEFYIKSDIAGQENIPGNINKLIGAVNFIYQIKRHHDDREMRERHNKSTSISKLYRKLLCYKYFHSLERPLLICEGKTDLIYLECALKKLSNEYPSLITKENDKFIFNIGFLKLSKTFRDVFSIAKGTSGIAYLMLMYQEIMAQFYGPGKIFPVIVIVDNDDGSKKINSIITEKTRTENPSKNEFNYFCDNLYVVHLPSSKGKKTTIESLFPADLLKTKIDGKKFNPNSGFDNNKEYSKIVFAEKVVRANQTNIDFNGFKPLFDRIEDVTKDYKKTCNCRTKLIQPTQKSRAAD